MFEYNQAMKWLDIDVVSLIDKRHVPLPLRVRLSTREMVYVINIDKILSYGLRDVGEQYYRYDCRAVINNKQYDFTLQYWISTCTWKIQAQGWSN